MNITEIKPKETSRSRTRYVIKDSEGTELFYICDDLETVLDDCFQEVSINQAHRVFSHPVVQKYFHRLPNTHLAYI